MSDTDARRLFRKPGGRAAVDPGPARRRATKSRSSSPSPTGRPGGASDCSPARSNASPWITAFPWSSRKKSARIPESSTGCRRRRADIQVVVAYGQIIPMPVIALPRHSGRSTSIFPSFPATGAPPRSRPRSGRETRTGVTIFRLNEKMDEGDILTGDGNGHRSGGNGRGARSPAGRARGRASGPDAGRNRNDRPPAPGPFPGDARAQTPQGRRPAGLEPDRRSKSTGASGP